MNDDPLQIELNHGEYCGQREIGGDSVKNCLLLSSIYKRSPMFIDFDRIFTCLRSYLIAYGTFKKSSKNHTSNRKIA